MSSLSGKKAVFIIASEKYRDEELDVPKKILTAAGVEAVIASSSLNEAHGTLGGRVKPDMLVNDINIDDYDAVIFVGGAGSSEYWDDPKAHKIARDAVNLGKVVAAICIAPVTLANAGILKGKKATVYPSESESLKNKGAAYTGKGVEADGNIITANGPQSAGSFAETIVKKLQGK